MKNRSYLIEIEYRVSNKARFQYQCIIVHVLLQPERAIFHGLSLKFDVSDFRRQMRDNIAASLKWRTPGHRIASFSRSRFFRIHSQKEPPHGTVPDRNISTDILEGLPLRLRQWVDPARQHGRTDGQSWVGCAVAKRKPQTGGIFFFHEDMDRQRVPLAYRVTSCSS